ncbi:MAG: hypothetical protein RJA25_2674 [Bacteroidota bacterium]
MNKTTKNIIIRFSMLIGLVLFIFLGVMAKINRESLRIREIKIDIDDKGNNFLVNKNQVLNLLHHNFELQGKILSGKDLERIEKSIQSIAQVKNANAYIDNKGNLNIKVEQRKPLFRVYNLQGQSFYVDENKIKFPTTTNCSITVPIVTGIISETCDTTNKIHGLELTRIFNTVQTINKNKTWKAMIGQYNIAPQAQIEFIPRFGDCTILFGDDNNAEQKLKQLDVFYFDVLRKVGWDYYKVINIMYKNQVVCIK